MLGTHRADCDDFVQFDSLIFIQSLLDDGILQCSHLQTTSSLPKRTRSRTAATPAKKHVDLQPQFNRTFLGNLAEALFDGSLFKYFSIAP